MIDTKAIRSKILDLALHGLLTEQLPEDGTAEELYQQIQAEKQELIKAGKIKKEKPLPPISEDEILFEIPRNWKNIRFGTIINLQSGQDLTKQEYSNNECGIPYITGASNYNSNGTLIINRWTNTPKAFAEKGDILLSCKGTVGKIAILNIDKVHIARQIMGIRTYCVDNAFVTIFLRSIVNGIVNAQKGLIPGIERKDILTLICPLPPLAEQKRIVGKIEQTFSVLDTIDDLQTKYANNLSALKSKLIDAAIQGKLTKQLTKDGTAEELYQQIQAEKQELIKAGKIKKEKPLQPISEDEIPFEIPKNWKWVRIGSVFNLQAGKNVTSADIYEGASSKHPYQCFGGNGCRGYVAEYNRSGHFAIIGRQGALCGNINYAEGNFYATEHAVVVEQFAGTSVLWCGYFLKALNLNQYATATAQPGLAVANINQVLIPLPPLAEQKRIVERLGEVMKIFDK